MNPFCIFLSLNDWTCFLFLCQQPPTSLELLSANKLQNQGLKAWVVITTKKLQLGKTVSFNTCKQKPLNTISALLCNKIYYLYSVVSEGLPRSSKINAFPSEAQVCAQKYFFFFFFFPERNNQKYSSVDKIMYGTLGWLSSSSPKQ